MLLISESDRNILVKAIYFYMDEFYPLMDKTQRKEAEYLYKRLKLENFHNED